MGRSFFTVFSIRLAAIMMLVAVVCLAVPRGLWIVYALVILAGALLAGFWIAYSLRRAMQPLKEATALEPKAVVAETPALFGDIDDLAGSMRAALARGDRALASSIEARQELEAMLDSMQDAVVAVDAGGRIQWTNQRMQRLVPGASFSNAIRIGHALVQTLRDPDVLDCVRIALNDRQVCERRSTSLMPGRIFEVSAAPHARRGSGRGAPRHHAHGTDGAHAAGLRRQCVA